MKKLSTRALLFLTAKLIRDFASRQGINLPCLEEFCLHLQGYATAKDLVEWDEKWHDLDITGYGDALPEEVYNKYPENANSIDRATQYAREIGASQMYTVWNYHEAHDLFNKVVEIVGAEKDIPDKFYSHKPSNCGWGEPVNDGLISQWNG